MPAIFKLTPKRHIIAICSLIILVLSIVNPAYAQSTQTFVIGEITNIPGGASIVSPTPTPVATATPVPANPAPSFSTNGQVSSRQVSFRASFAELGYVEGENVSYIFDPDLFAGPDLDVAAQKLVAANVDLIVAYGTTASVAAKRATEGTDIPVVFVGALDPVQLGLVESLQNTEGNVTGVGGVSEAYGKQLEWLVQMNPDIKSILVPYADLNNPLTTSSINAIQDFANKSGITMVDGSLPTADDVTAMLADLPEVDAILMVAFAPNPSGFIQAALENKIPLAYSFPNAMDLGPLLSYNYTEVGIGATAARFADRILKGAKPSDLPVELAPNVLAINLRTADAIGLEIPDEILFQAEILVR